MTCKWFKSNRVSVTIDRDGDNAMGENRDNSNNGCKKCKKSWNVRWNQRTAIIFFGGCFTVFITLVLWKSFHYVDAEENSSSTDGVELIVSQNIEPNATDNYSIVSFKSRGFKSVTEEVAAFAVEGTGQPFLPAGECTFVYPCSVVCDDVTQVQVGNQIKRLYQKPEITNNCNYTIRNLTYANNRGTARFLKSWFNQAKDLVKVMAVTFRAVSFETMDNGAFEMEAFKSTTSLILDNLAIKALKLGMFSGLLSLNYLELRNMELTVIDPYLLEPLTGTLTTLILEELKSPLSLDDLIATDMDFHLTEVSFSGNRLKKKITRKTFAGLREIKFLRFSASELSEIEESAFDDIAEVVERIDLTRNNLKQLPAGLFDKILTRELNTEGIRILLLDNPWHCDEGLLDLQETLQNELYVDVFDSPVCKTPAVFTGELVMDASMADYGFGTPPPTTIDDTTISPEDTTIPTTSSSTKPPIPTPPLPPTVAPTTQPTTPTTNPSTPTTYSSTPATEPSTPTTTTTTTESTTVPSTPIPPPIERITCRYMTSADISPASPEIQLLARTETFRMREMDVGEIEIILSASSSERVILWYHSDSKYLNNIIVETKEEWGCFVDFELKIQIKNLRTDTVYSFCVLEKIQYAFSPFNCQTQYMQPPKDQRIWLSQGKKLLTISVVIGSILLALLLGILITYFMLKKVPTLIHGRHPDNQANDAMHVPIDFAAVEPSSINESTYGTSNYMSPLSKFTPEKCARTSFQRSASDTSLVSVSSYISTMPSTPYQIMSWKSSKGRPSIEHYPEHPPPLPPYPNRKSNTSGTSRETVLVDHVYEGINTKY